MVNNPPNFYVLKLLLWNANGLKQHESEFLNVLLEKQIDLALISETHCKSNTELFFLGFKVYRTDHSDNNAHAGSLPKCFPTKHTSPSEVKFLVN